MPKESICLFPESGKPQHKMMFLFITHQTDTPEIWLGRNSISGDMPHRFIKIPGEDYVFVHEVSGWKFQDSRGNAVCTREQFESEFKGWHGLKLRTKELMWTLLNEHVRGEHLTHLSIMNFYRLAELHQQKSEGAECGLAGHMDIFLRERNINPRTFDSPIGRNAEREVN